MKQSAVVLITAVLVGAFTSASQAESNSIADLGTTPLASPAGGRPALVNPAEASGDNTADPGSVSPSTGARLRAPPAKLLALREFWFRVTLIRCARELSASCAAQ